MTPEEALSAPTSDQSLVILQSLLCMMREKNLLSRADIEDLCERVAMRAAQHGAKVVAEA